MSSLKYKLLLCVVALMVLTVPLYAMDVVFVTETFGTADGADGTDYEGWVMSSGSSWEIGIPPAVTTGTYDPNTAQSDGQILGYDLGALYANSMTTPKYATSPSFDCTDKVGVKLIFKRWLSVEDSKAGNGDKAIIQVSGDGGATWSAPIWTNPSHKDTEVDPDTDDPWTADLVDASWQTVEFDISELADGQEAVKIRWGLSSDGAESNPLYPTGRYGGWNIDDVELMESGPDALYTPTFTADVGSLWEYGPPVGTPGHQIDDDGNPLTPSDNDDDDPLTMDTPVGGDPATDSDGGAGPIWGTDIGGDYLPDMVAQYLTSSAFDCTGYNGVAVQFWRWLQIAGGEFDKASVQVQVDEDPDTPEFEDEEILNEDTEVALEETETKVWEVDTGEFYDVTFSLDYDTDDFALTGDDFYIDISPSGESGTWTTLLHRTTNTDDEVDEGVVTFSSGDLPLEYDNDMLYVRAKMDAAADAGHVTISNITVEGQLWKYAWQSLDEEPITNILDEEWTLKEVSIAEWADDQENVRVRFSIGPTDLLMPKFGGWSLDLIQIVEASREYRGVGGEFPPSLIWEEEGDVTVSLKNTGTGTWDSRFGAYEALENDQEMTDPENPTGDKITVRTLGSPFPVHRWGVDSISVGDDDEVAPDEIYDFEATVTAPPLSSVRYAAPVGITDAGDPDLSALDCDWALGDETAIAGDVEAAKSYMETGVAHGSIVVTRFSDDGPGTGGDWARYQTEELAGKVPFVVQGFGDNTYRPKNVVKRDALAVYIWRAAELPDSVADLGTIFHDVADDNWAVNEIQSCFENGIISGYGDATFRPGNAVSRAQMCKFIVNGAKYAGMSITVPTMDSLNSQAEQDAYPFGDVDCYNNTEDPGPQVDEREPLANYILAAADSSIVQGYPLPPDAEEDAKPNFKPGNQVLRDQLAVFVWRAIMRDLPAIVVLGGPGITAAIDAGDLTANVAPYSGFTSITDYVQADDPDDVATGYVTFDAVRLNGLGVPLSVDFTLTGGAMPTTTYNATIPWATVQDWIDEITDTDPNADTDGEPYKTVAMQLDTAGLDHGIYTMSVEVNGKPVKGTAKLSLMNQMFLEDWEGGWAGEHTWEASGQPTGIPNIYGDSIDPDNPEDNEDLIDGTLSLELQGTQAITIAIDTTDRHNIKLSADLAAIDFVDGDTLTVRWSKDGGANWNDAFSIADADAPDALDTISEMLPNGLEFTNPDDWADLTPEEQADPKYLGADDNPNFRIQIVIDVADSNEDGRGYVDNIELRGT